VVQEATPENGRWQQQQLLHNLHTNRGKATPVAINEAVTVEDGPKEANLLPALC